MLNNSMSNLKIRRRKFKADYPEYKQRFQELEEKIRIYKKNIQSLKNSLIQKPSPYQKNRIERTCENIGICSFSPLWHQNIRAHMEGLVSNGFEIMITAVSCEGLSDKWLGTILDKDKLRELGELSEKYRFNFDGEGGEYETLVVAGPHMSGRLDVDYTKHWDGKRGYLEIKVV